MGIFATIISGAIIGALARLFMKGKQPIGILWTIIIGIVAAIIGYYIAQALGVADTSGFDWIRWIISVVLAIIGISIYLGATNKKSVTK